MPTRVSTEPLYGNYVNERCSSACEYGGVIQTLFGTVDAFTDDCSAFVDALIRGIRAQHDDLNARHRFSRWLVRVEFIRRWDTLRNQAELRGAVIFDQNDCPILHLPHALLGYGGAGAIHSQDVLRSLGVPASIFDEINRAVDGIRSTNNPYVIIVYINDDGNWAWTRTT